MKGLALHLCRGEESSSNPAYFMSAISDADGQDIIVNMALGESWFRTAVKGKGKV